MARQAWRQVVIGTLIGIALTVAGMSFVNTAEAASVHIVQRYDTLWQVSRQYQTTVQNIRALNGLWTTHTIYPGQRLRLPAAGDRVHIVSRGETLWQIAQWYGSSSGAIQQASGLPATVISAGQALLVPRGSARTAVSPGATARNPASAAPTLTAPAHDVDLLARLITAEAAGELYRGQVAVGAVVLNRVRHHEFPNTPRGVIYDGIQWEPVYNGRINQPYTATAKRAAREALAGADPSQGALFFYNPLKVSHPFFSTLTFLTRIGDHWFYR
ncbi:MAG: cell wall hydrolase [Thermaerobacterales bacterium]